MKNITIDSFEYKIRVFKADSGMKLRIDDVIEIPLTRFYANNDDFFDQGLITREHLKYLIKRKPLKLRLLDRLINFLEGLR